MNDSNSSSDDCGDKDDRNPTRLSVMTDIPSTPYLERGVKNYFPEGVNKRKENSPLPYLKSFDNSLEKSNVNTAHSPQLLRLHEKDIGKSFQHHDSKYHCFSRDHHLANFSFSAKVNTDEKVLPPENGPAIFSKSFVHLEQTSCMKSQTTLKPISYSNFSQNNLPIVNYSPMRCESTETFFPDIFSVPSFNDRSLSAKSGSSKVSHRDDVISPNRSETTTIATSDDNEKTANHALSSENSVFEEIDDHESEKESHTSLGFGVHIRIKPLEDQDAGTCIYLWILNTEMFVVFSWR